MFVSRYDARNKGNVTLWSEVEPNGFGKRAYFQVQSPDGVLHLEKILYNEGGLFRCRVDFQTSQTRNSLFNLTVIGNIVCLLIITLINCMLKLQIIKRKNSMQYNSLCFSVPPGNPILMDKKGMMIRSPLYGPFNEGSSLTLTCKTNGGNYCFEISDNFLEQII